MTMMEPESTEKRLVRAWTQSGPALEAVRNQELAALGHEEAIAALDALLDLACRVSAGPRRAEDSGLVALQAALHRRPQR